MGILGWVGLIAVGVLCVRGGLPSTEYVIRSRVAGEVGDILKVPCVSLPSDDLDWRYETPSAINYALIDGIFLRYHCPGLDTVLWDRHAQKAYWVNPFLFVAGFLEDLSHPAFPANTQETETRLALYKEIRQALDSRKQAASHTPVKAGCVNFDYSRTRRCVGRQDLGPTNGTSGRTPVLPPDDEAGLQPKPLTTPPPIIATSDPTPRRDAATKSRRRRPHSRRL
ncbi:UL1 [Human alphaherpesvirus 1]|nr:UL1 [Human alphaherpesvirus 1]UPH93741.1 UL1 [Human alphaherpesvirus 1]UPH94123.1 UL1 [Human alphaherpesvirus 1]UPH94577.1 UL1 [Human alphaherpesvirus 1]